MTNIPPDPTPDATMNARRRAANLVFRVCGRPGNAERSPLPAGHPISWRLLIDGTTLEGSPYPYPVFNLDLK